MRQSQSNMWEETCISIPVLNFYLGQVSDTSASGFLSAVLQDILGFVLFQGCRI